jgi:hypothetical protein
LEIILFIGKHSRTTIEKIRMSRIGRSHTKETKIKISEKMSAKKEKDQNHYRAFLGHVLYIYKSIKKYAEDWDIPFSSQAEFKSWSLYQNNNYDILYNVWKESGWNKFETPIVIRRVKTKGFVISNLDWARKGNYSWWSGELEYLHNQSKIMEARQKENNSSTEDEQQEMVNRLKAKRKSK